MKCPKCHYLSFDPEPRCRNCGYTLSLDDPDLEIPLGRAVPDAPLADFVLRDPDLDPAAADPTPTSSRVSRTAPPAATPPAESSRRVRTTPGPFDTRDDIDFGEDVASDDASDAAPPLNPGGDDADDHLPIVPPAPAPAAVRRTFTPAPAPRGPAPATAELPLFVKGIPPEPAPPAPSVPQPAPSSPLPPAGVSDLRAHATSPAATPPSSPAGRVPTPSVALPPIVVPAEPQPPLAVRRPTPDVPARSRTASSGFEFEPAARDLLDDLRDGDTDDEAAGAADTEPEDVTDAAGPLPRLGAATTDAGILAALGAGVVWTTLRWCDLTWAQASLLPAAPMAAFLCVVALGYLFMFTAAGGQTPGKMALGIRVVDAGVHETGDEPLSTWQALYREAATIPSVLLLGAGFLPALFGRERALHDRLARTRVVRE